MPRCKLSWLSASKESLGLYIIQSASALLIHDCSFTNGLGSLAVDTPQRQDLLLCLLIQVSKHLLCAAVQSTTCVSVHTSLILSTVVVIVTNI